MIFFYLRKICAAAFGPRASAVSPGISSRGDDGLVFHRHRAITGQLRPTGVSGVTTVRGIWGFMATGRCTATAFLQLGRYVPAVTIIIGTPEQIGDRSTSSAR
jgi:hypothetical protein